MTATLDEATTAARGPRRDEHAERYVIGAALASAGRSVDSTDLRPDEFWAPAHEALWELIQGMSARGESVTTPSVSAAAHDAGIRGITLLDLHGMEMECATSVNVSVYARKVRRAARLRKGAEALTRGLQRINECPLEDTDATVEDVRGDIDRSVATAADVDLVSFGGSFAAALDRYETPDEKVLRTGWHDVDDLLTGGLRPGHLVIFGARPAVGKSVAAAVLAHAVAARGSGTYMASLEMSRDEFTDRVVANAAGVDLRRITERRLTADDWTKVSRIHAAASEWPLTIDDTPALSVNQIRARARTVLRRHGLGLIVIDYLQLVAPADRKAPRQEQVAGVARDLKNLAKELGVTVVALAQVNRGAVARTDKRPVMSDLRESGEIEAAADEIVLLHRDDEENPGIIEFNFEKNRHGRTGRLEMGWAPYVSRITSLAQGRGSGT